MCTHAHPCVSRALAELRGRCWGVGSPLPCEPRGSSSAQTWQLWPHPLTSHWPSKDFQNQRISWECWPILEETLKMWDYFLVILLLQGAKNWMAVISKSWERTERVLMPWVRALELPTIGIKLKLQTRGQRAQHSRGWGRRMRSSESAVLAEQGGSVPSPGHLNFWNQVQVSLWLPDSKDVLRRDKQPVILNLELYSFSRSMRRLPEVPWQCST